MSEHVVAKAQDIEEGSRLVVEVEGREIGIFLVDGEYYAYLNWCAHQAGPCAEGRLTGTIDATFDRETLKVTESFVKEDEILNCPWHGWEYDIKSGECLSRKGVQLPAYPVRVEDGDVILSL